jgi:hypothetical protein
LTVGTVADNSTAIINGNLTVSGLINGENIGQHTHTITHKANIIYFDQNQLDAFVKPGEIADVYDHPIGLDHPTDAICKAPYQPVFPQPF